MGYLNSLSLVDFPGWREPRPNFFDDTQCSKCKDGQEPVTQDQLKWLGTLFSKKNLGDGILELLITSWLIFPHPHPRPTVLDTCFLPQFFAYGARSKNNEPLGLINNWQKSPKYSKFPFMILKKLLRFNSQSFVKSDLWIPSLNVPFTRVSLAQLLFLLISRQFQVQSKSSLLLGGPRKFTCYACFSTESFTVSISISISFFTSQSNW